MYGRYQYATTAYSDTPLTEQEIQLLTPELMKYLPLYYNRKDGLVKSIQHAYGLEIARILYRLEDVKKQFFIDTATWGLVWYERDLGIETDILKPEQFRREKVKAMLRGRGTITKELIKNTARAFAGAEVEVFEYNSELSFVIKFFGVLGIPKNLSDLIEIIDMIKPAHLLYSFEYTYTWWNSLKELTWNEANTMTWDEIRAYG